MAKKNSGGSSADVKKAAASARVQRTEARKEKNRAANEARHQANVAQLAELGIQPKKETRTVTRIVKVGGKTVVNTTTRERAVRPSKLLRAARRQGKTKSSE